MAKLVFDNQRNLQKTHKEKKQPAYPVDQWVGIPEERFASYKNWRTTSGFLCGTYAASVLLAYYQDYFDENIIPANQRVAKQSDGSVFIQAVQRSVQPINLPTIPLQVGIGLSRYLSKHHQPYRPRTTSIGCWQRATKRIKKGQPVLVSIMGWLGSSYGNHWVTAYAFLETSQGQRYYKVHDNWGNYKKVIPASWGNGTVSLS